MWNRLVKATKPYRESGDSVGGIGSNGAGNVTLGDMTAKPSTLDTTQRPMHVVIW